MNQVAYDAIEELWNHTVKARALCPYTDSSAIGSVIYISPKWYQDRGAEYFIARAKPLTDTGVKEIQSIGSFINCSFVISMAAILEANGVVPYKSKPDSANDYCEYVQLTIWLRNRFAHGEWVYNADEKKHKETRELLEKLFPCPAASGSGFVTSIDSVLEPLKDGVLAYINAVT